MSRGRAIEAGQAAVRFIGDRSPLQRALRQAEGDLRAFGNTVGNIGTSLTTAFVATVTAFAVPVRGALKLEEALSGLDAAFGDEASAAKGFLATLQTELKLSQRQAADALTSFQRFFRGMGFGAQQAAQLSDRMATIAADLSAAGDISFDEAAGRIRSALTGSTTVLDQFGINLKQSAIEAEALRQGIKKTSGDLTAFERATINASLITQQFASNGILGAAKREADSASGGIRALGNQVLDLSSLIGGAFIPVIQPAVVELQQIVTATSQWVTENQKLLQDAAKTVSIMGTVGLAMQAAAVATNQLTKAIAFLRATLTLLTSPMRLVVPAIVAITVAITASQKTLEEWGNVSKEAFARFIEAFGIVSNSINQFDLATAFKAIALAIEREIINLSLQFGNFGKLVVYLGEVAFKGLVGVINLVVEGIRLLVGTVDAVSTAFNLATESSDGFFAGMDEKHRKRLEEINAELETLKGNTQDATPAQTTQVRRRSIDEEIQASRRRLAEGLPDAALAAYPNVAQFRAKLLPTLSAIGKTLQNEFNSVGDVLKADLEVAKELKSGFESIVSSGKRFIEQSKLGVLQRRLQELQNQTFRFEVASSFRTGALRQAFGIGTGDVDEQQLEVQKEMRDLLRNIEAKKSLIAVL